MKLLAICLGHPERLQGKSFKTGIYKSAVNAAVLIDRLGLVGDAVCNAKHHGGEDQAILLEGTLTLDWWAAELGRDLPPGAFGENLIIEGLDNRDVAVGDRFHIGEVVLEATCARSPCNTLAVKMDDPKFLKTYTKAGRPGIYCRVVTPGMVSAGDLIRRELYTGERVMIAEMLAAVGRKLSETERARFLAAPIGHRWRPTFET
ncbi:MOSC domain-containing protein [Neorhizobium galegae]|uniref:MOSC domain-containing protein n=1 Tax=Neorhizobium galegae TaxID=399 RepID=UPI000621FDA0|nr:MOSC domain-containing protein [Neorhizobium galegae]CDZ26139.1 Molybdenum cofactor sulphurase [Neorhizobium galegae bv. officinalis]KAA9385503.1 MOSC domain-containing protein [Neorhizobium galegae]KAB1112202.1 MOSC domain-containing protein [Neorhizobium galegae]MCM2499574.1 MOSC domain-containing protein [Neorhizobium galegae]MCQ1773228.1 MOSC domain-containing protein [Neorhizobium galegae]